MDQGNPFDVTSGALPAPVQIDIANVSVVSGSNPLERSVVLDRQTLKALLPVAGGLVVACQRPRHLHYERMNCALAEEFVLEVGAERLKLKQGDSVFAPRKIPRGRSHVSQLRLEIRLRSDS